MPYMNTVNVKDVQVLDWEVDGTFHVDCYYQAFDYYVVVEDTNGDRWVHEVVFDGRPELVETPEDCYLSRGNMDAAKEAATTLAFRVATRGFINLSHWDFHEFFSLTLEERMDQEYEREQMERYG
jgi:hypothetical protein